MKPLFTGSHADAAPPPAAPPRAAPGLARLALICDPAHHSSGPTLLLEIHDPRDRVPPHRHVHAVEMFFVLRGRVARGGGACTISSPKLARFSFQEGKTRPIGLNSAP
jgi:hypothetical protein